MRPARLLVFALGALLVSAALPQEPASPDHAAYSSEPLLAAAALPSHGADARAAGGATAIPSQVPAFGAQPSQASHEAVVAGILLPRPQDLAAVLPPPPQKVRLENSYGTVTVTHAAHLARRTACKACHGPGPIQKIGRYQPREAHDTCRACHVKLARGPTDCRGCHVKNVEPATLVASPEPARKGSAVADAAKKEPAAFAFVLPGAQPAAFDPAAAASSFDAAAAWPGARSAPPGVAAGSASATEIAPPAARREAFAGVSMLAATGTSPAAGISLGVTFEQGDWQFSHILEWAGGSGSRRALGLLAAGVVMPLRDRWTGHVLGVGGFDFADAKWASFLPALGARAGLGYGTGRAYVHSIDLSVTALADVMRSHDPRGSATSGALVSVSLTAGLDLGARR